MNAAGRQVRPWLEKRGQPCDEREPWLWHVAHCTKGASQRQVPKAKSELTNCLYFGLCLIRLTASNDDEATMTPEDVRLRSELEERLQFVMLVADLSAKFIGIPASEIDHEINDALQQVCDCLGLDVGVLWQWELGMPETFVLTHLYRPLGGPPVPERMDGAVYFPWSLRQMQQGKLTSVPSTENAPAEAAIDLNNWRHFGIKSVITFPLVAGGGSPFGVLTFCMMRAERTWPEPLVKQLAFIAQVFASALVRKRDEQALRESEARLHLAAESAGVGLWSLDLDRMSFWVTPQIRNFFGFTPDEAVTWLRFIRTVHPEDRELVERRLREVLQSTKEEKIEFRVPQPDGGVRWFMTRGRVQPEISSAPKRVMGVTLDITERKRAEEKLRQSSHALEQSPVSVVITDLRGMIVYVNRKFCEMSGYSSAESVGKNPRILKSGEFSPAKYQELWATLTRGETWRGEFHNRKKNGELFWESAVISPLFDEAGRITHFVGIKEDITARKQTEHLLHELSQRLIRAHEAERARLGRELHDDVTQRLARLAIDIGRAEHGGYEVSLAATLRSVRESLVQLSEDLHALSYRLHPAVLEDLGLAEALKAECERFSRLESVPASVKLQELPADLPPETALCLFRVAQEALRNVARHARAGQVEISVRAINGAAQLAVLDDGIGFDPALQREHPSLGLESMRERVLLLGGELEVESAPGQGTTILVTVPANPADGERG